jgi:ornithine cyclodeaminase/alanine dehydrogenase-like protein (mu-crystallin family)
MTSNSEDGILYLCRREVELACGKIDSVAVMRDVFTLHGSNQTILPDEAYLPWTNEKGERVRSLNMPGYVGGSFNMAGTKIINSNPGNVLRGLPRASGVILLYDTLSTRILCMMESACISSLRTASVTALAVDLFEGREIECLAIIGAGVLAQAHIELLVKRLSHLRQIRLFDLSMERVTALQHRVEPTLQACNVVIHATSTAEEAIRGAQLIVPVTTTTEGYIHFSWLRPGALLVNVSLDDPMPDVVFKADKIVVDDWRLVKNDTRRLLGKMYRAGQVVGPEDLPHSSESGVSPRRIDAQLGEVVLGQKAGRENADEIILVNPFGLAIEDVALATHVYRKARELGLGVLLER